MKRDLVDFHRVMPDHLGVHARLENWGLYVHLMRAGRVAPMWRFTRSNSRMWLPPEPKLNVDTRDGDLIEHVIAILPTYHAASQRQLWHAVSIGVRRAGAGVASSAWRMILAALRGMNE
jgi:hypothetical protein